MKDAISTNRIGLQLQKENPSHILLHKQQFQASLDHPNLTDDTILIVMMTISIRDVWACINYAGIISGIIGLLQRS